MADTTFVSKTTPIPTAWLQDLNDLFYKGTKALTVTGLTVSTSGITVTLGGVTVTGNSTITGTLGGLTGLTVSSGGVTVTGNSTITGTLGGVTTLTATTISGTLSTAAQPNVTSIGTLTSLTVSGASTLQALLDVSAAGAGQVKFPAVQNASANANTLDDYSEGVWTPGFSFGGTTTGWTFSVTGAAFTKIGKKVIATYDVTISAKGSAVGNCLLTGLPFTSDSSVDSLAMGGAVNEWISMLTTFVYISARINTTAGVTTAKVFGAAAAAASLTQLTDAAFQVGSTLRGVFVYTASA